MRTYAIAEHLEAGSPTAVTGTLPPSAPLTPPAGTCCKQPDGLCPRDLGDWKQEGWNALNFQPSAPHRYSFEVAVDKDTVTLRAVGDLDCDGTYSTFERVGQLNDGEVRFAAKVTETDPLE